MKCNSRRLQTLSLLAIMFMCCLSLHAQTRMITGLVLDKTKEPVIGANVWEEKTGKGTISDVDGRFSLEVSSVKAVIRISMIGYAAQNVVVGNKNHFQVILDEDAELLEEVVVVGYGSVRKKDLTGAVSKVNGEKFQLQANKSPIEMLRGTVAGVTADLSDPRPGANLAINIRGNRSLTGSNSALVVVDGMIYDGNLTDINPADIESMDILKDVSSCAIYGSRGANGVVMITTKQGKTEKPIINFNAYLGFQDYATKLDMESPEEYMEKRKMVLRMQDYRGIAGSADPDNPQTFLTEYEYEMYEKGQTVNGLDLITQNSLLQNYDLSISGKTERVNYFVSGGYSDQNGIVVGDNYMRYSFRSNIDVKATDWLKTGIQASFTGRDQSGDPANRIQATRLSPYGKIYHDDGELVQYPMFSDNGRVNPLLPTRTDSYKVTQQLLANIYAELTLPFFPGFRYKVNWMNLLSNGKNFGFTPAYKRDGANQEASAVKEHASTTNYTFDNLVKYNKTFGVHAIDLTFLYSYTKRSYEKTNASANTFPLEVLGWNKMNLAQNQYTTTEANSSTEVGMMGRLNYRLMDRYLLTATIRRDGASKFATNHRWATFPSVALGWIMSEESFLNDVSFLDMLKLRLSWGKAGNQYKDLYDALSLVGNGDVYVLGDPSITQKGLWSKNMANDNLTWETTTSMNIGTDFSFLKGRINGSVEYYNSTTTDLLVDRNIPIMSGYSAIKSNMGKVQSWGVELTLNGDIVRTKDWNWNVGLTWSLARNKLKSLYGMDKDGDGKEDDDISNNRFIGQPTDVIYGYEFLGIIQEGEEYLSSLYKPGYAKFRDLNDDDQITAEHDRKIVGRTGADWRGSVTTEVKYKGISLSAFFNIRKGGMKDNPWLNPNAYGAAGYWYPNIDWWTPENPSKELVSVDYPQGGNYPGSFLRECTYVRLQDLTLAYTFPQKLVEKVKLSNLRVYCNAKNLFTFTDWFGWDPEPADITANAFPMIRTFNFGVNVSF